MQRLKKKTDLTKKVLEISEKGSEFLLDRMYFTANDSYHNFLVFIPMLSSLIFNSNERVTNWTSNGISSENIKPIDNNLELAMSKLANGRVILKFNNSVLVQKSYSSFYGNFLLKLQIVYELNNWPRIHTNNQ